VENKKKTEGWKVKKTGKKETEEERGNRQSIAVREKNGKTIIFFIPFIPIPLFTHI